MVERMLGRADAGRQVEGMARTWANLGQYVDPARLGEVGDDLRIQQNEARWWRDASIAYWQSLNGLGLPEGVRPPEHSLEYYKSLTFPEAPGN